MKAELIKFRQKDPNGELHFWGQISSGNFVSGYLNVDSDIFTGKYDKKGKEIYENDVVDVLTGSYKGERMIVSRNRKGAIGLSRLDGKPVNGNIYNRKMQTDLWCCTVEIVEGL